MKQYKGKLIQCVSKAGTRLSGFKTRLRNKLQIAFGNPESKEQRVRRMKRIRRIALFATTSFCIGTMLWNFPRTRKIILSTAFRLKSRFSEIFSSPTSEPETFETVMEKLETTNKRILIPIVAACTVTVILGFMFNKDISDAVATGKAIEEEPKNPTSQETGGVGPSEWPEWVRIMIHEILLITYVAIPSYFGLKSAINGMDGGNGTSGNVTNSSVT